MSARLVVVAGPDQGQAFALREGQTLVLGRAETADARLSDPFASRTHCRVEVFQGKVRLTDAGSRSGTLVNGRPLSQCELQPGDVVKLGCTELLFQLEAQDGAPSGAAGPSEPHSATGITDLLGLVGTKIAQFEIQQKLATGCSGMVFHARDTQHDRPVALKVLWPDTVQDEEAVGRFVRAMETMLPVRHPNIVELYGAGRTGTYCWLAMEYVEGESLTQVILRSSLGGMLGWAQAFRVAVHVARGLQAAYVRDIIHRNITPANILVRSADQVVKLGDLLLAKALAGSMARRITQVGELVGDVMYMSPESTRSDDEVDGRSDIFSLGATVYAVLTGHSPYEGQTLTEVIGKIRQSEPVPPTSYQAGIPDGFERLVLRMLAKSPADRPQTPTDLLRELDRVGSREGIHA
jgi:eukaryotic-like serine/threonine-protein kinase